MMRVFEWFKRLFTKKSTGTVSPLAKQITEDYQREVETAKISVAKAPALLDKPKQVVFNETGIHVVDINNTDLKLLIVDGNTDAVTVGDYAKRNYRSAKYDKRVNNKTYYSWDSGDLYTMTLESKDIVELYINPDTTFECVGIGKIIYE